MKEFTYLGLKNGRHVKGIVVGADEKEVIKKLKKEGIKPISIKEVKKGRIFLRLRGVSEEEVAFSLIQLSTLLSAGMPLIKALELVSKQVESRELSEALEKIKEKVEKGESLADAFREARIFPEFLPEMLVAVQRGENLEYIFQITGEYLRKVSEFKGRVLSSITYPMVVISFSFISLFIAVKIVVPKIASVLTEFGKELPLITRLVLLFSDILTIALALLPLLFILFLLREKIMSKKTIDYMLLRVPLIGKISFYFNLARFSRVLSMLLRASVPINQALELAVRSISNLYIRTKLEEVIPEVEKGKRIGGVMRRTGVFPELFLNLVETGESSGELEKMLELASDIYEKYAERSINFWLRLIEPISILLIGVIVGIIVVSVLLPLMDITTGIGR